MAFPTPVVEVAFGTGAVASYAEIAPIAATVAWRLNEAAGPSAADNSGRGNTGTYTPSGLGTITFNQTGPLTGDSTSKGVLLDNNSGGDAYIQAANNAGLAFGSNYSLVVWFKLSATGLARTIEQVLRVQSTGTTKILYLDTSRRLLYGYGTPASSLHPFAASLPITDTNWHMAAVTWDAASTALTLYLDGVPVDRQTVVDASFQAAEGTAGTFNVGSDTAGHALNGTLSEFSQYAATLDAATIAQLYATRTITPTLTWTDITTYVRAGTVNRGRQHETDTVQAGTCTLSLDNVDGRFDAANTGGPYYGNLLPFRRIRVRFTYNAVTYYAFQGYVERWPTAWQPPGESQVTVTCVDGFDVLNAADISGNSWPQELSGARVGHTLNAAFWPVADRTIDTGQDQIQAAVFAVGSDSAALSHLQDAATTEIGSFFIAKDGKATFHDRYHRANNLTSQATFGDNAGELPYEELTPDLSKDLLVNDATVTRSGGVAQRAIDGDSPAIYTRRSKSVSTLHTTDQDAADLAAVIVWRYKDAQERIERIDLNPAAITGADGDSLWAQVLGRELGDLVTVTKRPAYGSTLSSRVFIEQIQHQFSDVSWKTTWQLSPIRQSAFWILDDPELSILDSTTFAAP